MPTFSDFLYGAIYRRPDCRFANIERFVAKIGSMTDLDEKIDHADAVRRLESLASELRPSGEIGSARAAEDALVARDLTRLAEVDLRDVASAASVTDRLHESGPVIQERLVGAGLPVGEASLRIVEKFPAPFDGFAWSAFAPDREDEEQFGIEPGVYFRSDRLRPIYSEALFAHEVIHTVTGKVDPEVYAMGLEEGIAEILGTCYGALAVLDEEEIRCVMLHGRHGVQRDKLWSVYLDHTRQASLLYREFGITGLVELVKRGRAAIHDAERHIALGRHAELDLPRDTGNAATTRLVDWVCCGYLSSHVFSPLECLLAVEAVAGRTLDEVCRSATVPPDVGGPALERLGAESALFIRDGDRVGYSNVGRYRGLESEGGIAMIRYLPEAR